MNASYSFAQAKSLVFDDLARQKLRIVSEQAEPKRPKFRQSRLMIGVIGTRMECRAGDETSANLNLAPEGPASRLQIGADRPLLVEAFRCVSFHRSGYGVGVGVGLLFPGSCFSSPCGCCGC
jgi:hypothetical protein